MNTYDEIRAIMDKVPEKSRTEFSPMNNGEVYSKLVNQLYEIISTRPEEDLLSFIDKLSQEKGYENGAEIFKYMA